MAVNKHVDNKPLVPKRGYTKLRHKRPLKKGEITEQNQRDLRLNNFFDNENEEDPELVNN